MGLSRGSRNLVIVGVVVIAFAPVVGWLVVPPLAILIYGSVTDTPPGVAPPAPGPPGRTEASATSEPSR